MDHVNTLLLLCGVLAGHQTANAGQSSGQFIMQSSIGALAGDRA